jgi:hypothetical protein
MTSPLTSTGAQPRLLRSTGAILLGFMTVVVLSLGTDQVLHVVPVYPPWGQPMHDPWLNLLALSYRSVYTALGGYITARLAPRNPLGHTLVLGAIGTVAGTAGAIATIPMHLGPSWYPIALALTGLPLTWLGGVLYVKATTRDRGIG